MARISHVEADTPYRRSRRAPAARASGDGLAAEQQQKLAAAAHRSTAQDLESQADAIDPDVESQ